nr:FAD-linked oxidase C-terminal domain-containing protein [Cupriavidus sp. UME77]
MHLVLDVVLLVAARGRKSRCLPRQLDNSAAINLIVHDSVHAHRGSISAEHGLGQLKREENRRYKSGVELAMMRAIKQALDPQGLMNPGKVI